jgi:urease accessory protein
VSSSTRQVADAATAISPDELLAAMRLASPSLPIGAFAYSQGLERAIAHGWVTDRDSTVAWICGLLSHSVARFDLPILSRLHDAITERDDLEAQRLDAWILAGRGSDELQAEEQHLGAAMQRLLPTLTPGDGPSGDWPSGDLSRLRTYVAAFALAAVRSGLSRATALRSYCYAWIEHQLSAATRLVPLGQTDSQAALSRCLAEVDAALTLADGLGEDEIGAASPGLAIASAQHETQHTRLFRS